MPGILAPNMGGDSIRDPRDKSQSKGKNQNPPRYMEFGGLSGPGKWHTSPGSAQSGEGNVASRVTTGGVAGNKTRSARGKSDD